MRYALRNQHKITEAYSPEILKRIIKSLDVFFSGATSLHTNIHHDGGIDKYPTLIIDDAEHTTNTIVFYIIGSKYDVYRLAFKEFIG